MKLTNLFVFFGLIGCSNLAQAQEVPIQTKISKAPMKAVKMIPPTAATPPPPPPPPPPTPKPIGQPVKVTNVSAKMYQKKFDELTAKGYRPMKVESKRLQVIDYVDGERPSLGYWATFQKVENSYAWVARHGLTNQAYGQEFERLVPQGYFPTDINVAILDGQESYSVIFEKVPNLPAWVARHGLNQVAFTQENNNFTKQGYKLRQKSSAQNGSKVIHAAVWTK